MRNLGYGAAFRRRNCGRWCYAGANFTIDTADGSNCTADWKHRPTADRKHDASNRRAAWSESTRIEPDQSEYDAIAEHEASENCERGNFNFNCRNLLSALGTILR